LDVDLIVLKKFVVRREIGTTRWLAEEGEWEGGDARLFPPRLLGLFAIVLLVFASLRVNAASVTRVLIANEAASSPAVKFADANMLTQQLEAASPPWGVWVAHRIRW
jgi:hypothetical protein